MKADSQSQPLQHLDSRYLEDNNLVKRKRRKALGIKKEHRCQRKWRNWRQGRGKSAPIWNTASGPRGGRPVSWVYKGPVASVMNNGLQHWLQANPIAIENCKYSVAFYSERDSFYCSSAIFRRKIPRNHFFIVPEWNPGPCACQAPLSYMPRPQEPFLKDFIV